MSKNLSIIDGHAHLNEIENLGHEFDRAKRAGVKAIIGVGMDIESNRRILEIAGEYPGFVFPAIGYHPWEIREEEIERNLAFVEKNISSCTALGEVGVDYKAKIKKPTQRRVFGEIIKIAKRYDKPLILHCRYSHQRVFSMILEAGVKRAVFHWYNASLDLLQEIVSSGYYVSATPALRYSPPHQEAMREAPIERILVETDCPVSFDKKESRPSDVVVTVNELARIKGMPVSEVADATFRNTVDFYELSL
ncbi:MAG: TatD family hydrolase [Thermodesulfobacteriota bacterium]|nr:TatD family hydrolase [Thermodesulfobacteriota bacterium]